MSFLDKLVGGTAITAVTGIANVVDKFVETPDERRAWEQIKLRIIQEPRLAQIELNKVEAAHRTIFVAGWRPFIGWTCAFGLAFTFIINPLLQWWTGADGPLLPTEIMLELVLGMLGLGALRTFEKYTGRSK